MVSMQMDDSSPSPQPPTPTPQCVGREFVRQYYTLLAEAPRFVHRFYSNESIFVHGSDAEEIVGQLAIQNKIRDLSFEECRTRIRALDAHETLGKGVVVQVVGEISVSGGPMRRFVQTFVLAPQSEKKYYVHNDIFRYEDELFSEKLAQENGAPADPDAVTTDIDHRRLRSETPEDQLTVNNGSTHHPDEIQNARYNLSESPAQQQPMLVAAASQTHTQSQSLPPQVAGSGYAAIPATLPLGMTTSGQPQVSDAPSIYSISGDAEFGSFHPGSAATAAQAGLQQSVAPVVTSYGQQPLPQRPQPQQGGQGSSAPSPVVAAVSVAPPPSTQPPPLEPSGAAVSTTETEQPPRPASVEKTSPAPSDEREEAADSGSCDKTWANVIKQKNRSPHQVPAPQQQSQHGTQAPGTSAPAMLSPTGPAPAHAGQAQPDLANRPPGQHQYPPNRQGHPFRPARSTNAYSGGASQDARVSPAPSGHQPNFAGGGGRPSPAFDSFPPDQQVFVKNLPHDTQDKDLKEFFETQGYGGILDTKVRRKNPNTGQSPACFAFMVFDSAETAQKLIQKKNLFFRDVEITMDPKLSKNERQSGGNFPFNGPRQYPGAGVALSVGGGFGRGGAGVRGGATSRGGGGAPNRSSALGGPGGYVGHGGGGGGRQLGGRTVYSSTGRGGNLPHAQ